MPISALVTPHDMAIAAPSTMRVLAAASSRAPVQPGQPQAPAHRKWIRSSRMLSQGRRACRCAAWGSGGSGGGGSATPFTAVLLSAVQMLAALQLVSHDLSTINAAFSSSIVNPAARRLLCTMTQQALPLSRRQIVTCESCLSAQRVAPHSCCRRCRCPPMPQTVTV